MKSNSRENVYAFDIQRNAKHISEIESGKKGYYCMGCGLEMIARKGNIMVHHFAHDPKDIERKGKCSYSDETYRHKLAKDILQRIKKIKVPTLYKYPPSGIDGPPIRIAKPMTISASYVKNERQFYEDDDGQIRYGQHIDFEKNQGKHLLIQPDVTFFNNEGKPILFIELVATHKISAEKLSKIRKLGINTIQVSIPKDSPEEIERTFSITARTKWVYNHEREKINYLQLPQPNNQGIPPIDEFERKLLRAEESFECRKAQINNLIRSINKCLGSEQYSRIKQRIRTEIQRVEDNTERDRERLQRLQGGHRAQIESTIKSEEIRLDADYLEFREREREFRDNQERLEDEYRQEEKGLDRSQKEYRSPCESEITEVEEGFTDFGGKPTSFEEQMERIRNRKSQLQEEYKRDYTSIERSARTAAKRIIEIRRRITTTRDSRNELQVRLTASLEEIQKEFGGKEEEFATELRKKEEELKREIEERRRRTIEAVEKRSPIGTLRINREIRKILEGVGHLLSIREGKSDIKRLRRAKELFDSGAYKEWIQIK